MPVPRGTTSRSERLALGARTPGDTTTRCSRANTASTMRTRAITAIDAPATTSYWRVPVPEKMNTPSVPRPTKPAIVAVAIT